MGLHPDAQCLNVGKEVHLKRDLCVDRQAQRNKPGPQLVKSSARRPIVQFMPWDLVLGHTSAGGCLSTPWEGLLATAPLLLWWQPAETPCWLALDGGSSVFSSGGIIWSHSASHSMKHLQSFKGIYSLQPQWDERSAGFLVWRQRGRSWVLQPGKTPEETKERPCTASSK